MIAEKLREIREETGMNKKEFAKYIGVKYTTYNNYETGAREPASDFLVLVSRKFDVSIDYLLGTQDVRDVLHSYKLKSCEYDYIKKYRYVSNHYPSGKEMLDSVIDVCYKTACDIEKYMDELAQKAEIIVEMNRSKNNECAIRYIHYYQRLASAGTGQIVFDTPPTDMIQIPATSNYKNVSYAIGVNGNSMEPLYYDGDILLIEICNSINVGEVGIFMIGCESYVKKLGRGELISMNPDYPNIPLDENSRCMGRVIDKFSNLKVKTKNKDS